MAEMELTSVDMQDFLDVLYPFLERHDALEVDAFWTDKNSEEQSKPVLIEDLVQFVEDNFIDRGLELYGIKANTMLVTFTFVGDILTIDYPGGFENEVATFRSLHEDDDYEEELKDEVDGD
ncbi:hypothetical protein HOC01_00520 [archaeon]|jgi:hypothetical protein|nr:hypothetical protein [archaeon]MBT6698676.1 hypothetical protein [archaeon]